MEKPTDTSSVSYHPPRSRYAKTPTSSIDPIGIDTEADVNGRCFMIATSEGDVWTPDQFPECLFDRKHRDRSYVCYNLKYDAGALLQHLSETDLQTLRLTNSVTVGKYRYRVIANKMLGITHHHNHINVYDMLGFYGGSLDSNARKYLGETKMEQETKRYTAEIIAERWDNIAEYCVKDAVLVKRLADRLIGQFNQWGLHVRKLYSTAHVSYAWFSAKCGHPSVEYFWRMNRKVLDYAMASYNGGKFEITKKGRGYLYEYDIASAYPESISRLIDLQNCRVVYSPKYRKSAVYGFLKCRLNIPPEVNSPVAVKRGLLNTYPVGVFSKVITREEYDYFVRNGVEIQILEGVWIHVDKKRYIYRDEIMRLYRLKQQLKNTEDRLAYHTVKILMNSLYGKFVQLIEKPWGWQAGASWNPIYASVITAETRIRISELQNQHPSVWAVHTDSIISDKPLPYPRSDELGAVSYEIEGDGLLAGCGIYQIGSKTALRGVPSPTSLIDLATDAGPTLKIDRVRANSWRQVLANGWDIGDINRFVETTRELRPNVDKKRLWLNDAQTWHRLTHDIVESAPLVYSPLLYGFTR